MNERMKTVRKALKLSQEEFADKLGLSRGAITNIELNKVEVKDKLASLACTVFSVSEDWLRNGGDDADMFVKVDEAQEIADYVKKVMADETAEFQQFIIELMTSIPFECWQIIEQKAKEYRNKK